MAGRCGGWEGISEEIDHRDRKKREGRIYRSEKCERNGAGLPKQLEGTHGSRQVRHTYALGLFPWYSAIKELAGLFVDREYARCNVLLPPSFDAAPGLALVDV